MQYYKATSEDHSIKNNDRKGLGASVTYASDSHIYPSSNHSKIHGYLGGINTPKRTAYQR